MLQKALTPQHLFFFSYAAAPPSPGPYTTWSSGLTRSRPNGGRATAAAAGPDRGRVRSLAFGPIYLSIKCLRSRSIELEVRVAVTGQPPRRHRPIQLVTRQCLDRILGGGGGGGGEKKNELADDRMQPSRSPPRPSFVRRRRCALGGNPTCEWSRLLLREVSATLLARSLTRQQRGR